MNFIKKFYMFLKRFFSYFMKNSTKNESSMPMEEEFSAQDTFEFGNEESESDKEETRLDAATRTIMTKLYMLEQDISVFEHDFPKEHQSFMERIEELRTAYNASLEEIKKLLTFEIDPEIGWSKSVELQKLEREITRFKNKDVKFSSISKRLQRLITKLNIVYNVTILHSKESEKEIFLQRIQQASESATELAREFKQTSPITADRQLKERIISLISYADYVMFKISMRISTQPPKNLIKKLVMVVEFDKFDYVSAFKAFIEDELTDLLELLSLITDERFCESLRKQIQKLIFELSCSDNAEEQIFDTDFWSSFFAVESYLFEMLKISGVEKDKIKIPIIERMEITVEDKEVLVLPKNNAYVSLTELYAKKQDAKILVLIKLMNTLSDNVTYKEIYFLTLLFDVAETLKNVPNGLIKHIEQYFEKYPYNASTIKEKKDLLKSSNKEDYVVAFSVDHYEKEIIRTLKELNIDFDVHGNNVLINSFYFSGLENVQSSLQDNTKNMMI